MSTPRTKQRQDDGNRVMLVELLKRHYLPPDHIPLDRNTCFVNTDSPLTLFDTSIGVNTALGIRAFGEQTSQAVSNMPATVIEPRAATRGIDHSLLLQQWDLQYNTDNQITADCLSAQ